MRQGIFLSTILVFFFSSSGLAQQDNYTFLYEQSFTKIGMKSWSAGGTGIVEPGLSGAALNNPACMRFNEITASAEFGRYFYTQSDFELSQNNIFIVPELVEVGMPYSNYNFEVGYANVYNYYSSYSLVGTHENGIVYFDFHSHVIEHSIFGSANMSEDQWSYGVTLGVNYLTDDKNYSE